MSTPIAFLITYANGHTVVQAGEDVEEQTGFSVSRGFATRRDLEGGAFELTSTDDGRTRRYEPLTTEPSQADMFRELHTKDGWGWEDVGIISSALARRLRTGKISRGRAQAWYLVSGTTVILAQHRQIIRFEPLEAA